eukprot:m.29874 g.29874  ORF g.29874 m.29874 type:complete len:569 (+) comp6187_c0_seq3:39-1745(+)
MRCHYEVLDVEQTATDDELKKAYRKKARLLHPDKNVGNEEEATTNFQVVQAAYAVLSDPQERAWYDKHREALLCGGIGSEIQEGVNVMPFFSSTAFSGFGHDEHGFYVVYGQVFQDIIENEQLVVKYQSDKDIPKFGNSESNIHEEVKPFYMHWEHFTTRRQFHSCDKWDLRDGPDRRIRRLMEKDNKKLRQAAKKEYVSNVKNLVAFVKRRDPRYEKLKEFARKQMQLAEEERRTKLRKEELRVAEERKRLHVEAARQADEMFEAREEKLAQLEEQLMEHFSDEDDEENDDDQLYCIACKKGFKSQKQLNNHEKSKKHKNRLDALRREMMDEDATFFSQHDIANTDNVYPVETVDSEGKRMDEDTIGSNSKDGENTGDNDEACMMPIVQRDKKISEDNDIKDHMEEDEEANKEVDDNKEEEEKNEGDDNDENDKEEEEDEEEEHRDNQNNSNNGMDKKKKKKKRRAQAKKKTAGSDEIENKCNVCGEVFSSRSKLFKHINVTKHSRAEPIIDADSKTTLAANSSNNDSSNPTTIRVVSKDDDDEDGDPWADAPRDRNKGKKKKGKRK